MNGGYEDEISVIFADPDVKVIIITWKQFWGYVTNSKVDCIQKTILNILFTEFWYKIKI